MVTPTIVGVPRATPRIDLGVGDARDALGLGQWQPAEPGNVANTRWQSDAATGGTSTWNGEEPYWVDVTEYGVEIETFTGRDRAAERWEVGTATIVLNNTTGWADYPPTQAPQPVRPDGAAGAAGACRRRCRRWRRRWCCGVAGSTRSTPASTPRRATSSPSNASTPKVRPAGPKCRRSIRRSVPAKPIHARLTGSPTLCVGRRIGGNFEASGGHRCRHRAR